MLYDKAKASNALTKSAGASPRSSLVSLESDMRSPGWTHVLDALPKMYQPDVLGASTVVSRPVAVRPRGANLRQAALGETSALVPVLRAGVTFASGYLDAQGGECCHH